MTNFVPAELQALLTRLYARERSGINLDLAVTKTLLSALGSPEKKLRAIHIAGTNGKGSVAALVTSILQNAGYRVGLYTSPHLIDFGERIQVDGQKLSPEEIITLFSQVESAAKKENIQTTFFEATTAMALLHFASSSVDFAILEAGLGGRLDATNICHPIVTAIVTVDFDHTQFLGTTISQIAREKAGIAKPGIPMVCGQLPHEARIAIGKRCAEVEAPLSVLGEEFFFLSHASGLSYHGSSSIQPGLTLSLRGAHQRHNAAVAIRIVEILGTLGYSISSDALLSGAKEAVWPGRLELFANDPRVLLDGAHNPHAASALGEALDDLFPEDQIHLIFGASADKEIAIMLKYLLPRVVSFTATRSQNKGAMSPEEIANTAKILGSKAQQTKNLSEALSLLRTKVSRKDLIVIAGSLFLVGEAKQLLMLKG